MEVTDHDDADRLYTYTLPRIDLLAVWPGAISFVQAANVDSIWIAILLMYG